MSNRKNTDTATDTPATVAADIEKMRAMVAEFSNARNGGRIPNNRDRYIDRGLTADDFTTD